jgi:tRNA(Ile)-lysidine synthase
MEVLEKIKDFAQKHRLFPREGLVLVAVSGGADSMCLLAALTEISEAAGFTVAAAHFNHRLRGSESDADEAFVARFCLNRGIRLLTGADDVRASAEERGIGIEEAARDLRYGFLEKAAADIHARRIATAHTADDNAETVLLNLTRGTGLKGLGGIPPVRGPIIRPMLTVTRREVLHYLASRSIGFTEDSTNSLDIYSRNLIRHRVIPVLLELNPRFAETVTASALLLREDEAYLSDSAARFISEHFDGRALKTKDLQELPKAVSSRVIRNLADIRLTANHTEAVLKLIASDDPSGQVSLPGCTVYKEYDTVVFSDDTPADGFEPVIVPVGGTIRLPGLGLAVSCRIAAGTEKINNSFNTFLFNYDNIYGNIVIRSRKTGDKIRLSGGNGTKTLKKLFIEKRIPARRRSMIPVIADDSGILAVYGIGTDVRAAVGEQAVRKPGDNTLEITFEETRHEE